MARGRTPKGPELVNSVEASEHAKKRLKLFLETISGDRTIASACEELGISESAFYKMRSNWLSESASLLEPKQAGRPAKSDSDSESRIRELEEEVIELKLRFEAAMIREEIALVMPHVLVKNENADKKKRFAEMIKRAAKRQSRLARD